MAKKLQPLSRDLQLVIKAIQAQRRKLEREEKRNKNYSLFAAKLGTGVQPGLIGYVLKQENISGAITALNELEYNINPNFEPK